MERGVTLDDRGGKAGVKKFIFWEKVSEMTPEERELFDEEFQYGFSNDPNSKPKSEKRNVKPEILRCFQLNKFDCKKVLFKIEKFQRIIV